MSSNAKLKAKVFKRATSRKTNKMPKLPVFAAYGGVFALIVAIIAVGYQPPQPTSSTTVNAANVAAVQSPIISPVASNDLDKPAVDEVLANDIAAHLAERTNMPVSSYVASMSVSLAAKTALSQTSDSTIVKPEIIQATLSSRDITTYVAQQGDTVSSVAASYSLQPDTIRWANNLTSDTLSAGKSLTIPPIDGVVYTVKAGDTPEKVASTYKASGDRIISFNDLEISGMTVGSKIIIPNGVLPETQRPGYQAPVTNRGSFTGSYSGSEGYRVNSGIRGASAGNRYAWGNCTWYAFERRLQMGQPVGSYWGNAKTWAYYARMDGYLVNRSPSPGAVFVDMNGYYGHVGVVEEVRANGDVVISEMNNYAYGGFGVVNRRTMTAGQAALYQYIH